MHFASIATVLRMCKDLPNLFYLGHENNYSEIVVVLLLVLMHLLLLMTMRITPMKVIMIAKSRLRSCLQVVWQSVAPQNLLFRYIPIFVHSICDILGPLPWHSRMAEISACWGKAVPRTPSLSLSWLSRSESYFDYSDNQNVYQCIMYVITCNYRNIYTSWYKNNVWIIKYSCIMLYLSQIKTRVVQATGLHKVPSAESWRSTWHRSWCLTSCQRHIF